MSETTPEQESDRVLNLGVDLGTSRSSVSASNGVRQAVESYVGWPLDMVARKVLKRDVLVGREAIDNRLMLDLHRPLERGLIKEGSDKDVLAVRELLKHLVSLALAGADRESLAVQAVVGVPAEALRVNKQQLRSALKGIVDSLMIVFATSTSRQAAHSSADPRAVSKKRQRSAEVCLPFPSAIFSGIEVDARSNWL